MNIQQGPNAPVQIKSTKKEFSLIDSIFAIICIVLGYLVSRWIIFTDNGTGLGAFLIILSLAVISIIYMREKKIAIPSGSYLFLALIIIFAAMLVISSNSFIKFLILAFVFISSVYWFFCTCGNTTEEKIGDRFFPDIVKSAIAFPFSCFADAFSAIGNLFKKSSTGKKIFLAICGILIAVIPTAVISSLLVSADDAFKALTSNLFENFSERLPENILYIVFGIPAALYIFGVMYSNYSKKGEKAAEKKANYRFLPVIMTCAAITPIILVYLLFFLSQTSYFLSAFSNIRPENITYAEYARKGFFELCAVSVINMAIIITAGIFTKKREEKASPVVKTYIVTLSAMTLVLIAIALSKMFMYINVYGFTLSRIYATWFMILLAVVFVLIVIKQLCAKFNLALSFVVSFVLLFGVLVFSDVDAMIAKYNVYWYTSGKFKTVDVEAMYDLSPSAVKYVIPLIDDENPQIAEEAREYLKNQKRNVNDITFHEFSISRYQAKKALAKLDLESE